MTQEVFVTGGSITPLPSTVSVDNFPNPQNVAGSVTVDSVVGTVTITGDVNVTTNPLYASVTGSVQSLTQPWNSDGTTTYTPFTPELPASVCLPGYNTVAPTVTIGPSSVDTTATPLRVTPTILLLWDASNNQWRAAQCDTNGKLSVAL